jgi:uncharacterized protein (DUF885 family)
MIHFSRWYLAAALFCTSIHAAEPAKPAALPDQTAVFQKLVADDWERGLVDSPTRATWLGDKRFDDRWPDLSLPAIERRAKQREELLAQLKAIDPQQLAAAERLNYRLFRRQLETEIAEFPFGLHLLPINQRDGIQDEHSITDAIEFRTVKDFENWLARLKAFPEYGQQTIELLREGKRRGIIHPQIVLRRLPAQIKQQIVDDPMKSPFYKPFRNLPDSIPTSQKNKLLASALLTIEFQVIPFYRELLDFIEKEYLPAGYEAIGAWQFPRGEEFYALRARGFTTTSLTPDEIHELGLKEVARIRAEMEKVVKQLEYKGTFAEFLQELRTDKKHYFTSSDELLAGYQIISKRIDPQLPKLFKRLPRIPYGVEAIPANIAPDTTTGYYREPSLDGRRAGAFFVNLYRPEMRPKYEMEALTLHEAVPGHHLQIALASELTNLPMFRRQASFTAFVEGWALYGESLGPELGCYKDPYSKFGQLTYEMWRAVRLVVDTGMHHKRWTRDRAIVFFRDNTAKTEVDIVNEIDRYIAWPGQALAYKIGELKIRELRQRAEKQLGDKFDLREFHDVVLREGPVPLDVLEELVDAWIAEQK